MKPLARTLRRNQTQAEQKLWRHLRNRGCAGHKFRRQLVIGRHIVDFVCLDPKLVIEIDGGQHLEQKESDDRRTRELESRGYRVLRFWNNQVLTEFEAVLETIRRALAIPSSPSLLPEGGGRET